MRLVGGARVTDVRQFKDATVTAGVIEGRTANLPQQATGVIRASPRPFDLARYCDSSFLAT